MMARWTFILQSTESTSDDDLIPKDKYSQSNDMKEAGQNASVVQTSKKGTQSTGKDRVPAKKRKIYKNRESLLTYAWITCSLLLYVIDN